MSTKPRQLNLKMPSNLYASAEAFAQNYGYRNVQELAMDSLREKIFEKSEYDESFTEKEIELIDRVIEKTLKKGQLVDAKDYFKDLE